MNHRINGIAVCLSLVVQVGCPRDDVGSEGADTGSGGISASSASVTEPGSTGPTTADGTADSASASTGADTTADPSAASETDTGSTGVDPTGNNPGIPATCAGTVYACGDGEDNDGDGLVDLLDPECTGPCDDDESSFQTGLPGDNVDCKQDCFFDGNSGQGDDGCIWNLRCDPENPGADIGCAYTGGNNCNNQPPNQSAQCIMFCEQYVPPGCDCFGCCEIQTDEGAIHIFLNSGPDCALDNLDACQTCTYQVGDCGTPCVPEQCDICFGETEPPEGCDQAGCQIGEPCAGPEDCQADYYCLLGCCYPPPAG